MNSEDAKPPRTVDLSVPSQQYFLSLSRDDRRAIADALLAVAGDPFLLAVREQDGQKFVEIGRFVVLVDVDDDSVQVLGIWPRACS